MLIWYKTKSEVEKKKKNIFMKRKLYSTVVKIEVSNL